MTDARTSLTLDTLDTLDVRNTRPERTTLRERTALRPPLLVAAAYVLLTLVTVPFFMGDTIGYADAIAQRRFSDFGHLGWYWIGYAVSELLMPVTRRIVGPSLVINISLSLVVLSLLTGLMSVLLMRSLVFRMTGHTAAAYLAAGGLMVSQSFLNFTQSGCSYTFGMAFLLLGLWVLVARDADGLRRRDVWLAGGSLFVAVAVWFTYVFSIPAVLLAPAILEGITLRRLTSAVQTGLVLSVLILGSFGVNGYALGVRSVDDVRGWVVDASHGVRGMDGVPRTILGFGRSIIDTGNDGPMVKAYLLKDPYNPVSLRDIATGGLWKLALFYGFVALVVLTLARAPSGRRLLAVLAINAVPVLGFAILWQGGAIERYLLLFPVFFVAVGCSLASAPSSRIARSGIVGFVLLMAAVNLGVMAAPVQAAREEAVSERVSPLQSRLPEGSLVAVVNQLDETWAFEWNFPFNPTRRERSLPVHHLVEPGTERALVWREVFADAALASWDRGGNVWVSRRVRAERPLREWRWIEGEDPTVSWRDVVGFFAPMEMESPVGGEDGFLLLPPSPVNRALLSAYADSTSRQ